MHLSVNIRDWLDDNDEPATPALRSKVLRIARLIEYGGTLERGEMRLTLVECSRRPGRKPCEGLLFVTKTRTTFCLQSVRFAKREHHHFRLARHTLRRWTTATVSPPEPKDPALLN